MRARGGSCQSILFFFFAMTAWTARADQGVVYATFDATGNVFTSSTLNPTGAVTSTHNATGQYTVTFANSAIGPGWAVRAAAAHYFQDNFCDIQGWASGTATVACFNGAGGGYADSPFTVLAVSDTNDKNIGFALADQPSAPSYTPGGAYTYNPSAGGITVSRSGTGAYTIYFNGLSGNGGTVQVDGAAGTSYCYTAGWGGAFYADVRCIDHTGTPVDSRFVIFVISAGATPTGLAFSFVYDDSTPSYTPAATYTYNPTGGAVRIVHGATGNYELNFAGLDISFVDGGYAGVTSFSSARCIADGPPNDSGGISVEVWCYDLAGNPVDSEIAILLLPPMGYAAALIDDANTAHVAGYVWNPGGAPVTATHESTGTYLVTFPHSGIGPGWNPQVVAYGQTNGYCKVGGWANGQIGILCFNSSGALADSEFAVQAFSSTNGQDILFAFDDQPTAASNTANPAYTYNPGGTIVFYRLSTGMYSVAFNQVPGTGGNVQVTAYGAGGVNCYSGGWVGGAFLAYVYCVNSSGAVVDSEFGIAILPPGVGVGLAGYALADQPTNASYTPSANFWLDLYGTPVATRSGPGTYAITFPGLNFYELAGGFARVTPVESAARCAVTGWTGGTADITVNLNCYNFAGALADSEYSVLVLAPMPGPPAAIALNIGSPQSTVAGTAFSTPMIALVTDSNGNPILNALVDFTAPGSGASGTFQGSGATAALYTDRGLANAPVFTANNTLGTYTVTASTFGVSGTANFSLTNLPLPFITLQTSPAGLQVSVDGDPFTAAPVTTQMVPGSSHTIATQSPQPGGAGVQSAFTGWSDAGAISHTITAPSSATTYTATFKTQYQLTTAASPAGGGTVSPTSGAFFDAGAAQPIGATPSAGYSFGNWSGPVANSSAASTTVTMNAAETVTANFLPFVNITIQTIPAGLQFTVDGGPAQTAPQTLSLSQGSHTLAVAATQTAGIGTQYVLTGWSDSGAASHNIVVTSSAATYTATFKTQYQLSISASPASGGSVTPANGTFFDAATAAPISATANPGFAFNGWSGLVANPSSASTTVAMNAPTTVVANFSSVTGITIQTNPPGRQFTVDGGPAQTAPQTLTLSQGTHAIAVATTQTGATGIQYLFTGWSDSGAASHNIAVTSSAATYTATFQTQYQLTISASPAAGGTVTPASGTYYNSGVATPIAATANSGYTFTNWTGTVATASSASTTVAMTGPETVTANFNTVVASCSFSFTPPSASLPPTGTSTVETCPNGSGQPNCGVLPETAASFTVTPSAACGAWTVTSSNPSVLRISAGAGGGTGAGSVGFTLLNNTHTTAQSYNLIVSSAGISANFPVAEAGSGNNEIYRQVYALYEQLLGRNPDGGGFAFWTGSGGSGLGQMADDFLTSPEAFNSDFAVMAAYQAATGNPPSYAQYAGAVAAVQSGTQSIAGLFNSLTGAGYSATTLYQNLLGRAPTAGEINQANGAGLANWFATLIGFPNNTTPVNTPNNEFQSTGAFHTDHSNGLYVRMIYYVTVSRDPDPAGLSFWTGVANNGGAGLLFQGAPGYPARLQILGPGTPNQGFIGSPEFQGLFAN